MSVGPVSLRWVAGQPLLSVEDDGAGFVLTAPCLPEDLYAEGGRGLFIVAALADQVRVVLGRRCGGARVQVRLFTRSGAGPTAQG